MRMVPSTIARKAVSPSQYSRDCNEELAQNATGRYLLLLMQMRQAEAAEASSQETAAAETIKKPWAPWRFETWPRGLQDIFKPVEAPQAENVERSMIYADGARLRMVTLMMVLLHPLIMFSRLSVWATSSGSHHPAPYGDTVLLLSYIGYMVAGTIFLVLSRNLHGPEDATRRQRYYQYAISTYALVYGATATVFTWPMEMYVYVVVLTLVVAVLRLRFLPSVIIFGLGFLMYAHGLTREFAWNYQTSDRLVLGFVITLAVIAIMHGMYANSVRALVAIRLVEQQRQDLANANRQLMETNTQLQRMSFLDPLTGGPNRRYFDEYLDREFSRAQRERSPLSMIMIDVDHFKEYNDNNGHQAGDECLSIIATAMGITLKRPADLIARYGGDEFAAILPDTDNEGAQGVARRILEAVRSADLKVYPNSESDTRITISAGVATFVPKCNTRTERLEDLIAQADDAMYQAKFEGRDRFVSAA